VRAHWPLFFTAVNTAPNSLWKFRCGNFIARDTPAGRVSRFPMGGGNSSQRLAATRGDRAGIASLSKPRGLADFMAAGVPHSLRTSEGSTGASSTSPPTESTPGPKVAAAGSAAKEPSVIDFYNYTQAHRDHAEAHGEAHALTFAGRECPVQQSVRRRADESIRHPPVDLEQLEALVLDEVRPPQPADGNDCQTHLALEADIRAGAIEAVLPVELVCEVSTSRLGRAATCPLAHGTACVDPYPGGYIHGRDPRICKFGCTPVHGANLGETAEQTLRREADEFIVLYFADAQDETSSTADRDVRRAEVQNSIDQTGTYAQTAPELEFGARAAWRNAPKCVNRKFWDTLSLLDARHCDSNEQMFDAIKCHLVQALSGTNIPVLLTAFRPETPGTSDGPRVWNSQLLRYAGYQSDDGSIMGDPTEVVFTQFCKRAFGWEPPGGQTAFDLLPLVLQASPDVAPQLFVLPDECIAEVKLSHPKHRWLQDMHLKWYGVPAVSSITLTVGGLAYTASKLTGSLPLPVLSMF
jgi:hypothetical protein